ncbi:hypothetical protein B0H14DRAFT_2721720 [Mycena olivaceomarginata]|nr:hypothetical protein B0H14DRAFT_2721720 [Mycena olivaceomarginata]
MTDIHSKQLETAHAFLKHFSALDLTSHYLSPSSISPPDGKEWRGKEDYIVAVKSFFPEVVEQFKFLTPLDVIHGSNTVVFHVKSDGIVKKSGNRYNNEYMLTFNFDGEKIVKMNEFMDSKYFSPFLVALGE